MSKLPAKEPIGRFSASLSLDAGGGRISGRRLDLLVEIGRNESINSAAKVIGMTYKAAWEAVEAMNNLAGVPLVAARQGGRGGGGAELTEAGKKLVAELGRLSALQAQFIAALDSDEALGSAYQMLRRVEMKTSARNALAGTIESIKEGAVNAEIALKLAGGDVIYATITRDSARSLELKSGRDGYALINASWIILTPADETIRTSARNRLCGVITLMEEGAVNAEVVLELADGVTLAAIITNESCKMLGLSVGDRACALIKASHVIIGVVE